MDPSQYKDITVRGVHYHYYHNVPKVISKPTLLFLHGFPSTSEDWVHQVKYFSEKGYGVIAPDMLGYGGTSKPEDPKAYSHVEMAAHCVAILDAEGVDKAVVVGHDWGVAVASRLINLYPERHLASIFLSVPYNPPIIEGSIDEFIDSTKKTFGHDLFSYVKFFASEESPKLLAKHEDSFYDILYTTDPSLWRTHFSPEGTLKKWLIGNNRTTVASWAPSRERFHELFRASGWIGPTNWYRANSDGFVNESSKAVPKDRYKVTEPVLLVAALRDYIAIPALAKSTSEAWCTNLTVRELDTSHWGMIERPDEVNVTIEEYLQRLLKL